MNLRNIAIIAHVDHGKTTLVDGLFRQGGLFHAKQRVEERAMDSMDQERERGITILSKCTSILWQGMRINVVDTPGHADFGGEVERILNMVDGVLLLVDAAEGAMPQTKFVTAKALKLGLRPIVVVNKVDRPDSRVEAVHEEVFDLFAALDASDEQLDFPILYASAKEGWASEDPNERQAAPWNRCSSGSSSTCRRRPSTADGPFRMLATTVEYDPFLGRVLTGRISSGSVTLNATVKAIHPDGTFVEQGRLTKVLAFRGLKREGVDRAEAGDIVALAGLGEATVADTICDPEVEEAIHADPVDPPTLSMTFSINDSPFAGQDGDKVTSRMIRDRLFREAEGNVAIRIAETAEKDAFEVSGRGELQLGVLIETLRREGFELSISRPRVLYRFDPGTHDRLEPIEEVQVDVDDAFSWHRRRGDQRAEGRAQGNAPLGRRQDAADLPGAVARADRLSRRVHDRDPRHRRAQPGVPRLRPLQGPDPGAAQRRADLQRHRPGGRLWTGRAGGARAAVHRAGHQGLRGHGRRRAHAG